MHYFIQHLSLQLWAPRKESGLCNMLNLWTFICLWLGLCPGQSWTCECAGDCLPVQHTEPLSTKTSIYISTIIYKSIHTFALLCHTLLPEQLLPSWVSQLVFRDSLTWPLTPSLYSIQYKGALSGRESKYLENNTFYCLGNKGHNWSITYSAVITNTHIQHTTKPCKSKMNVSSN